jgi:DNA-binding GntR family transcriptional regulator
MSRLPEDNKPRKTKVALVYEELKRSIMDGEYEPGSRVVGDQLAEQLGMSAVPVREAIVRLASEGWLEISPHVGAVVPPFDPNEILENALIRAALESSATRLATPHLTASHFRELRRYLDAMDEAAAEGSPHYPRLNLEFHQLILSACPYKRMRDLVQQVAERTMRLRTVTLVPHYVGASQAEHRELVRALEAGDADRAEDISRRHIEQAGRLMWERATAAHRGNADAVFPTLPPR